MTPLKLTMCLSAAIICWPGWTSPQPVKLSKLSKILSYAELERLPEKKRIVYIREIAAILETVESAQNLKSKAFKNRAHFFYLNSNLFSQAFAETSHPTECPEQQERFYDQDYNFCAKPCDLGFRSTPKCLGPKNCTLSCIKFPSDSSPPSGPTVIAPDSQAAKSDRSLPVPETTTDGCAPPPSCQDEQSDYRDQFHDKFTQRVRSKNDNRCIVGGMIGTYTASGSEKCQAVTAYHIGTLELSCDSGQTMCNPLLFGLSDDGKSPICLPIGLEMTRDCYNKSSKDSTNKFLDRADLERGDLIKKWEELRSFLSDDLCTENVSANYHCTECKKIEMRLRELNKLIDACQNDCGKEIKCFTSIKSLSDPPPAPATK